MAIGLKRAAVKSACAPTSCLDSVYTAIQIMAASCVGAYIWGKTCLLCLAHLFKAERIWLNAVNYNPKRTKEAPCSRYYLLYSD